MSAPNAEIREIAVWLGIVSQLYTTRMSQLLGKHEFTLTQFAVLNHLARHQGEKQTISALTEAVEVNQPGMTKIVKKFMGMGLVESMRDSDDSRKKHVTITQQGLMMSLKIQQEIAPDVAGWFAEWGIEEKQGFLQQLRTLGIWLDGHRLD